MENARGWDLRWECGWCGCEWECVGEGMDGWEEGLVIIYYMQTNKQKRKSTIACFTPFYKTLEKIYASLPTLFLQTTTTRTVKHTTERQAG